MKFNHINDIVSNFNLKSNDKESIRSELNTKRSKIHPDKNGGVFKNSKDEQLFISIGEAINFLDNYKETQSLVPVSDLTELIKVVSQLIPNNTKNSEIETEISNRITAGIETFRRRSFIPKLGLTAITAIVTFIFAFPETITKHPVLKELIYFNNFYFSLTWLFLLLYTCRYWYITFVREEKAKHMFSNLKTERLQNKIFEDFLYKGDRNHFSGEIQDKDGFSKDDLVNFILFRYNSDYRPNEYRNYNKLLNIILRYIPFLIPSMSIKVDEELAQSIAENIISRLENKKIILKTNSKNLLSDFYKIA